MNHACRTESCLKIESENCAGAESSALPPVNLIGALLEGRGEAPEGDVEHAAHQHAKHSALELVVDEKLDVACLFVGGLEPPAVLHAAERTLQIFDQDLQLGPVERDAAAEGLA